MTESWRQLEYDFLGRLATAETIEEYEREVVPFCREGFDAQSVLTILYHRHRQPHVLFRWTPDTELRENFDQNYCRIGYMLDPFYQVAFDDPGMFAGPLREIAPDRFETSDYFSNYFQSTRMVDELGGVIVVDNDNALHLSLGRNSGQRRYRASEIARFRLLARVLLPKLKSVAPTAGPGSTRSVPPLEHRFTALILGDGGRLSEREAEVAALIVQGHSSRAIGLKLGISIQTVKVHRRNLYKKLSISSQSELFGLLAYSVDLRQPDIAPMSSRPKTSDRLARVT